MGIVVARRRDLRGVRAQLRRQRRRRRGRPARRASRLDYLAELGIDAIWLTPVLPLADGRRRLRRGRLPGRRRALRHDGRLRQAARRRARARPAGRHRPGAEPLLVRACRGSRPRWPPVRARRERERFHFRAGRGEDGEVPPNDWWSVFGGPAWTRRARRRVVPAPVRPRTAGLQLGPSRGTGRVRRRGAVLARPRGGRPAHRRRPRHGQGARPARRRPPVGVRLLGGAETPFFDQDGVHDIYREWRSILDSYTPERIAVAEAWVPAGPDRALRAAGRAAPGVQLRASCGTPWSGPAYRGVIDDVAAGHGRGRRADDLGDVQPRRGAPRLPPGRRGRRRPGGVGQADGASVPATAGRPAAGPRRDAAHARAARLGLPVPGRGAGPARGRRPAGRGAAGPDLRADRRRHARPRRLPGAAAVVRRPQPPYGFGPDGSTPWLPQPAEWA